jgi:septation ring formation regulator EzrA
MIVGGLLAVYVRSIIAPLATKLDGVSKRADEARENIKDLYKRDSDARERLAGLEGQLKRERRDRTES